MSTIRSLISRLASPAAAGCAVALAMLTHTAADAQVLRDAEDIPELAGSGFTEKLGNQLPLDIQMLDAQGNTVTLGDYFNQTTEDGKPKPVLLALVYYDCPIICKQTLTALTKAMIDLDYDVGLDYNTVVVSFDPSEVPTQARAAQVDYVARMSRPAIDIRERGYTFHVAGDAAIQRLLLASGFRVFKNPTGEYAHPVALIVASPDGTITNYFPNFDYPAKQLKLSMLDATDGKIAASIGDIFLHTCWRPDPNTGVYTLRAMLVMRWAAIATVILLAVALVALFAMEPIWRRRRLAAANAANTTGPAPAVIRSSPPSTTPGTKGVPA